MDSVCLGVAPKQNDVPGPAIGICLCCENSTRQGQIIKTLHLSPSTHYYDLTRLRGVIFPTLSSILPYKKFAYLTSQGWEISQNQEHLFKLSDVLTKENTLNIRICHQSSRIGILIQGNPDIPLGFVLCDLSSTVKDLTKELSIQLPELYKYFASKGFFFLDQNGWPIAERQESMLQILEISLSSCVKLGFIRDIIAQHHLNRIDMFTNGIVDANAPSDQTTQKSLTSISCLTRHFTRGCLMSLQERPEYQEASWPVTKYSEPKVTAIKTNLFEIIISYVHTEGSQYACLLKDALESMGYTVFLDIHCIEGGKDWQDVLNNAITNCSLFIPLITMQYGNTLWTNREVKLADILGKLILPVNFNDSWPPMCLAIQFATTQYIPGSKVSFGGEEMTPDNFTEKSATDIAKSIAERYHKELLSVQITGEVEQLDPLLPHGDTEILPNGDIATPCSDGLSTPLGYNYSRRSSLRSCASTLPECVPIDYQKSVFESRQGKPLVVISCCQEQRDFTSQLTVQIEAKGYEVWPSCDIDFHSNEERSVQFQKRFDEAGVVIFVLSKDFADNTFCEQQVYYCEQRKRIIPLIYEPMEMPNWMATLIGTSTFVDCKSQSFHTALMDRIETLLNPVKADDELKQVLHQKMELAKLCTELLENLPEGKYVYISGGTQFFSKCGKAICEVVGKELARDESIVLVTGGFYGVGETVGRSFYEERERMQAPHGICHVIAVRDSYDKSTQTRQNADGMFCQVPYGDTLFFGNSVRQREMLTPRVVDLCVLIEGGPGAAFEAQQFVWNTNIVIPVRVTGGAAGGKFNVPSSIFNRPTTVSESLWSVLGDEGATALQVGRAVAQIAGTLVNQEIPTQCQSHTKENGGKVTFSCLSRRRGSVLTEIAY